MKIESRYKQIKADNRKKLYRDIAKTLLFYIGLFALGYIIIKIK